MIITVGTLVRYLKNKLDSDANLQDVNIKGELSNFRRSLNGHLYFTLKDETSTISCVMFASRARFLSFSPLNGDQLIVSGTVSMFENSGQLQLYVGSIRKAGIGDLYLQYEQLKKKLAQEGYFDNDHKKTLKTPYPEKIAVLCGDRSAAQSDIKTCFARRWPLCTVDYYPVVVQGKEAPADIIAKLDLVDSKDYDAIILARGGGSFEDLFCFNDENLVKRIYTLKTFIVCGIGHEQDFTLVDFVADLRAPTPTAAVELVTPSSQKLKEELDVKISHLDRLMTQRLKQAKDRLDNYLAIKSRQRLYKLYENQSLRLDLLVEKLLSFGDGLSVEKTNIERMVLTMATVLNRRLENSNLKLEHCCKLLEACSLNAVLSRGFAIVRHEGKIVDKCGAVKAGDLLDIKLADGNITSRVVKE